MAAPVVAMLVVCGASEVRVLATTRAAVLSGLTVIQTQRKACVMATVRVMVGSRVSFSYAHEEALSFIDLQTEISA